MNVKPEIPVQELIPRALAMRAYAYAPYSHFTVGACLMTADGSTYDGCNIENASFGATNCAERTAIFKAVSEGKRKHIAIAIAAGMEGKEPENYTPPCGICRQVMTEFADDTFQIILAKSVEDYRVFSLGELLPGRFTDLSEGRKGV